MQIRNEILYKAAKDAMEMINSDMHPITDCIKTAAEAWKVNTNTLSAYVVHNSVQLSTKPYKELLDC